MFSYITSFFFYIGLITIVSYAIPLILAAYKWGPQDLKKKYNAKWALVSGASSGIGRAVATKLAQQGLNVVLVALDDEALKGTHQSLSTQFPNQQFRAVGVNLGRADETYDYMPIIEKATKDIDVQILINNAGYIQLSAFFRSPIAKQLANLECNMMSHVKLTHFFLSKMVEKKLKGCITFTSSQSAFFPAPSCSTYGGGKAFLAEFAASLAIECHNYGIDVLCLMSGPIMTQFYDKAPKLSAFKFFHSISDTPDTAADIMLNGVGHITWRDSSLFTMASRLVVKVIDMNLLIAGIARGQGLSSDFKNHPELR
ncbi:hypothetical protein SAMD00019534_071690 [Acytostelium subglobosum LB1]|uniref:hypothetical protein n=1 Tax=Acytostelium subglobosum LB1 TaxID=1410327 RepID=UPI000644C15E|nr:hypothetical protein SAMD00019534_071690 [Acytostelium subglobosum LB1]GAM23994.1 hypothetical protein SAMD00019534_071690 [Acytostelium subglobosum LB1]|eukprot:XP_012753030.1 hypothetical protein SAMD00019534_071690 [Acytostelium subglobosum LB1]